MTGTIGVRLLSRPGCHLCDEMKLALENAARGLDWRLEEVDISQDPALLEEFGNDIPVLFVNGERAFRHRATEERIRERLLRKV